MRQSRAMRQTTQVLLVEEQTLALHDTHSDVQPASTLAVMSGVSAGDQELEERAVEDSETIDEGRGQGMDLPDKNGHRWYHDDHDFGLEDDCKELEGDQDLSSNSDNDEDLDDMGGSIQDISKHTARTAIADPH